VARCKLEEDRSPGDGERRGRAGDDPLADERDMSTASHNPRSPERACLRVVRAFVADRRWGAAPLLHVISLGHGVMSEFRRDMSECSKPDLKVG
jgi:hypothetical protein